MPLIWLYNSNENEKPHPNFGDTDSNGCQVIVLGAPQPVDGKSTRQLMRDGEFGVYQYKAEKAMAAPRIRRIP